MNIKWGKGTHNYKLHIRIEGTAILAIFWTKRCLKYCQRRIPKSQNTFGINSKVPKYFWDQSQSSKITGSHPADLLNQPDCLGRSPRPHLEASELARGASTPKSGPLWDSRDSNLGGYRRKAVTLTLRHSPPQIRLGSIPKSRNTFGTDPKVPKYFLGL